MDSRLHQRVLEAITRLGRVSAGARLGVAVSGGADSVALFLLLRDLGPRLGAILSAVHLNHQLRGAEADADEQFVWNLSRQAGTEFHAERTDVAAEARRMGWNLEDAGRRVRQRFFQGLVDQGRVDRVAVAHTADDQAETVLAHLLRGTGLTGLAGIHRAVGPVIRPLLSVRREELRTFLSERGQEWREDSTNHDPARLRARIRHHLLPLLEKDYQPAVVDRLRQLAELAGGEEEFWSALADDWLRQVAVQSAHGLSIPAVELAGGGQQETQIHLLTRSDAAARRLVRRTVQEVTGERQHPGAAHIERVMELARRGHGGQQIALPGGVLVERTLDHHLRFWVAGEETKSGAKSYEYSVGWPLVNDATVQVAEVGSRFSLKLIDWPPAASETRTGLVPLDAGLLTPPLTLRNWRPGDAYRPVGRQRVHKLKELLYQAKVEAHGRQGWPILTSAGVVVWARGLPPAAEVAAHAGTRKGVWIDEERIEE